MEFSEQYATPIQGLDVTFKHWPNVICKYYFTMNLFAIFFYCNIAVVSQLNNASFVTLINDVT